MKGLLLITFLAICASGLAQGDNSADIHNPIWWPTQPPWWPSAWPTWPTRPTTIPPTTTPPTTVAPCVHHRKYPHPEDCAKYYLCLIPDKLFELECPKTLHFHNAIQDCDIPERAKCQITTTTSTTTQDVITTTEVIGNTTMTSEEPVTTTTEEVTTTPTTTETVAITTTTDVPVMTTATPETTTTTSVTTTTTPVTTTATPVTTTTTPVTTTETPVTTPPTTTTTQKPTNPGGINCNAGMYHPHPTDCTKFYQCSNGVPYLQPCPAGLHFNPTINVCDWPNAAGCTAGK